MVFRFPIKSEPTGWGKKSKEVYFISKQLMKIDKKANINKRHQARYIYLWTSKQVYYQFNGFPSS